MPVVDRRRACPEHEAAVRACVATRAAVARGEQRFRLRTPTSRSAPGLPGRFAIPMPAMRARLPDRRVHRRHLAPAGRDGVRGVCYGAAAVNPLSRARRRGPADAVLGERPRLASGPDPRRKHRPGRRHVRSPQLASRPCTRGLRTCPAGELVANRSTSAFAVPYAARRVAGLVEDRAAGWLRALISASALRGAGSAAADAMHAAARSISAWRSAARSPAVRAPRSARALTGSGVAPRS